MPAALAEMPHYVPGDKPTVPGHETVVRIVKVGPEVETLQGRRTLPGRRPITAGCRRQIPTPPSATISKARLQEYVLVDERVITSPDGESMLIPAPEDLSASAIALVEPWACVEDAYVEKQRQHVQARRPNAASWRAKPRSNGAVVASAVPGKPGSMVD